MARRSIRSASRAHNVRPLVGRLHSADRRNPDVDRLSIRSVARCSLFARNRRSDHVSRFESICVALDSLAGARRREWMDLRGSWCGLGAFAFRCDLHDGASRMALFVLGLRAHRLRCGIRLVSRRARQAGAAFERLRRRTRDDRRWVNARCRSGKACGAKIAAMGRDPLQHQHLARHPQLFLLRLCRVDIFCVVLPLSQRSARPQSESERVLRNASVHRDGDRVPAWWLGLRRADSACRPAHRSLHRRGSRRRSGWRLHRVRLTSGQRAARQRGARRRSGRTLFFAEFVLGGQRRSRRPFLGFGIGIYEHGCADWRRAYRFAHSMDCCPLRLDCVIYGSGSVVWSRSDRVVSRESGFEQGRRRSDVESSA